MSWVKLCGTCPLTYHVGSTPPMVEEEDFDLYPPEIEAYRKNNWDMGYRWMSSGEMDAKIKRFPKPYFLPIMNLGRETPGGRWRMGSWDGGEPLKCDRIAEIKKLRPDGTFLRIQKRIEVVKGHV